MRKVDKKAFLSGFDKSTILGNKPFPLFNFKILFLKEKTFAFSNDVRGDDICCKDMQKEEEEKRIR